MLAFFFFSSDCAFKSQFIGQYMHLFWNYWSTPCCWSKDTTTCTVFVALNHGKWIQRSLLHSWETSKNLDLPVLPPPPPQASSFPLLWKCCRQGSTTTSQGLLINTKNHRTAAVEKEPKRSLSSSPLLEQLSTAGRTGRHLDGPWLPP